MLYVYCIILRDTNEQVKLMNKIMKKHKIVINIDAIE